MADIEWIEIRLVSKTYELDDDFFDQILQHKLLIVEEVNGALCMQEVHLGRLERIIRLHEELEINMPGIDVVLNLLERIQNLENLLLEKDEHLNQFLK